MNHSESCIFIDPCFSYFPNKTTGLVTVPLIYSYCFVMLVMLMLVYGDIRDEKKLESSVSLHIAGPHYSR